MSKKYEKVIRLKFFKEIKRRIEDFSKYETKIGCDIPTENDLNIKIDSGFYFGLKKKTSGKKYVGRKAKDEGNILVVGINGSNKSFVIAKSTLITWMEQCIVTDPKGELLEFYIELIKLGIVKRKYISFAPKLQGIHYDVYALLRDDSENIIQHIREISHALIEKLPNTNDPYWINAARSLLCAIISYCHVVKKMDFTETMIFACSYDPDVICEMIKASGCKEACIFINDFENVGEKQKGGVYQEMKETIILFATDKNIMEALSYAEEAESFSWVTIEQIPEEDRPNVFMNFPQELLGQWGGLARLMITQLIAQMQRRKEKFVNDTNMVQPLLIMLDEFPLLGEMEVIKNAVTTLRSKGVTFCFMIQSVPQLDEIYGTYARKYIIDNCKYKVILNVTEPESQIYISETFGTRSSFQTSVSICGSSYKKDYDVSFQVCKNREPWVYPEELATNEDVLLSINGRPYRIYKIPLIKRLQEEQDLSYRVFVRPFLKKSVGDQL